MTRTEKTVEVIEISKEKR